LKNRHCSSTHHDKIIEEKSLLDVYVNLRSVPSYHTKDRVYWDSHKIRTGGCVTCAITKNPVAGGDIVGYKGTKEPEHANPPNQKECATEVVVDNI